MNPDPTLPIGVFDSGVGGLTVVRALMERLPFENITYFGDTARVPYGVKSVETITGYAGQITEFLLKQKVKLLIIACNTIAAVAGETVRDMSPVPVLDVIDAGIKDADGTGRIRIHGASCVRSSSLSVTGEYGRLRLPVYNSYSSNRHSISPLKKGILRFVLSPIFLASSRFPVKMYPR